MIARCACVPPSLARVSDPLLQAVENLSHFHREHEKFYAREPRAQALRLQDHARALNALADRWAVVVPTEVAGLNPFEGSEDLNADAATQLDGILFMQGEGEPAEITRMKRDIRVVADDSIETGEWLANAMEQTWAAAMALLPYVEFADLIGDRHRIIGNDWQAASMSTLAGRVLHRSVDLLDHLDLTPASVRSDLDGERAYPRYIHSSVELIDHAADLLSDSAGLVHDNEPRWRRFRTRVLATLERGGA
jgi:hypothetical protein